MALRLGAIAFIFCCTSAAWVALGSTVFTRTYQSDSTLREKVESVWGSQQTQSGPLLQPAHAGDQRTLPLERSRVQVTIDLDHRQKGLLWYSTYRVGFQGDYTFRNGSDQPVDAIFRMPLPAATAIYDDLTVTRNGAPLATQNDKDLIMGNLRLEPLETVVIRTGYRSNGLDRWQYQFGRSANQVRDFELKAQTNFRDVDFPDNTLAPTSKQAIGNGWDLAWNYKSLVSGVPIALVMPEKLQPGPLAGTISYFAPVSLFFFFFLLFVIATLREIRLHPMNYFFLAAAFFSFHVLLAYLVDHISIHLAFLICSAVSIGLVISYLRLVVGIRFAAVEAGLAQFVYLVLFSYAFFFKGFTGLTVTIGAILTLFFVMQLTGRVNWEDKLGRV